MKLKKIFEPITINGMTVKNRMMVSAMVTNFADEDGTATERFIAYHEAKAKGGWGLIIPEDYIITPDAGASKRLPGLYSDDQIESHQRLTDRVHAAGSKIIAQIYHAGNRTSSVITGKQPVAPSAIPYSASSEMPREMTVEDIQSMVEAFGDSALRAKKAGFDGVEIHGAHGYLISAFVSPYMNKRNDSYGGTLENRARFALEVVTKVREKVGSDFPIFYRMSTDEYIDGGFTIEEAKVLAMLLEDAGIDAIHCSQGGHDPGATVVIPPAIVPRGSFIDNAAAIKAVVDIPVITVGRINDPLLAESILRSNKADLVTMARASLADPELPNKAAEGRLDEILHCIGCVQGCKAKERGCLVNPLTGHEFEYDLSPVAQSKKVYIAGGGISGCEAAIIAAKRGHQVVLFEQSNKLGGQWKEAAVPIGKEEFLSFLVWQEKMLEKLGIEIRLETKLTKAIIQSEQPDTVIIATGSNPFIPPVKGLSEENSCFAIDVLKGQVKVGRNVVVIGGGLVGCETADYLAMQGHKVTIVEMLPEIMKDGEVGPSLYLKKRFEKNAVQVYTSAKVAEVSEHTIGLEQQEKSIILNDIDSIIIAAGVKSENGLIEELKDCCQEVIAIGDAHEVKNGLYNLREAFKVGLTI